MGAAIIVKAAASAAGIMLAFIDDSLLQTNSLPEEQLAAPSLIQSGADQSTLLQVIINVEALIQRRLFPKR
jgi:hypothetical protein